MNIEKVPTIFANIYVGLKEHYSQVVFDYDVAYSICQEYVNEVGLCVTFTKTEYIYTEGNEVGLIIGLINYPRFPSDYETIYNHAMELGKRLKKQLNQHRVSIMMNDFTYILDDNE